MSDTTSNLFDFLEDLVTRINNAIDPIEAKSVYKTLPANEKTNLEYLSKIFCSDSGTYEMETGKCNCDIAYFGPRCFIPGKYYWGGGWTALVTFLSIFYIVLAILTWYYFIKAMKTEHGGFAKKLKRIINTPKYLVVVNLIIISTSNIIFN